VNGGTEKLRACQMRICLKTDSDGAGVTLGDSSLHMFPPEMLIVKRQKVSNSSS